MKIEKNKEYRDSINRHAPASPCLKNCIFAFLSGGFICFVGQWLFFLYSLFLSEEKDAYLLVTITFIVLASVFTGLGFFDKIARVSGAGTLVPVTGFSNAVTSSALDTKKEGFISGLGAKIFTVAGPVILYSSASGTIYGIIYFFVNLFSS